MTVRVPRLFWESQCILFFCASHSPYLPLHFNAFPRFVIPVDLEERGCLRLVLALPTGRRCVRPCPPTLPQCCAGRFGERPVLPRCRLMAAASLSRCPWPPGSQRQTSAPSADAGEEEQSDHICPFTKAILSVVPSVPQLRETQWALWKRQKISSESGEKMDVKIRCWELVGAWVTPEQTKNKKPQKPEVENTRKKTALKWRESQQSLDFSPVSSPVPFLSVFIFSHGFYSGEQIQIGI